MTLESRNAEGKCQELIEKRVSQGIMGRGTESFAGRWQWCSRDALDGDTLCSTHRRKADEMTAELERRRADRRRRAGR